jgi:hypothetical protein
MNAIPAFASRRDAHAALYEMPSFELRNKEGALHTVFQVT